MKLNILSLLNELLYTLATLGGVMLSTLFLLPVTGTCCMVEYINEVIQFSFILQVFKRVAGVLSYINRFNWILSQIASKMLVRIKIIDGILQFLSSYWIIKIGIEICIVFAFHANIFVFWLIRDNRCWRNIAPFKWL